jgi:hypothetical protein
MITRVEVSTKLPWFEVNSVLATCTIHPAIKNSIKFELDNWESASDSYEEDDCYHEGPQTLVFDAKTSSNYKQLHCRLKGLKLFSDAATPFDLADVCKEASKKPMSALEHDLIIADLLKTYKIYY